jgi:hypothetical protein
MFSPDQVPTQIEQITDSCVGTQESLSLSSRFELSHPSLSDPGRLIPDKAGQALASFRWEGFQLNSIQSAGTPLRNSLV